MTQKDLPSPELLRKLLRYEPETGKLFWLERSVSMFRDGKKSAAHSCAVWNSRYAETEAFTALSYGYRNGQVCGRRFPAHRVIWTLAHGAWPKHEIDHINGVRDDNRIANLREATHRENGRNQKLHATNTSGVMGVFWHKQRKKWVANISDRARVKWLGQFSDKADAIAARRAAEIELGYHKNHGRVKA